MKYCIQRNGSNFNAQIFFSMLFNILSNDMFGFFYLLTCILFSGAPRCQQVMKKTIYLLST